MNMLIKNAIVVPMTASQSDSVKYFKANIAVNGGKILFVSDDENLSEKFIAENEASLQIIDAGGKVAMPGLINLHNHVSMSLMRGYADDMALMPWLTEKIWPFEAKLTREDIGLGAELGIAEMLMGGTTTFADMYWENDMIALAAVKSGIRAVVGASFIDFKLDASIEDAQRLIEKYHLEHNDLVEVRLAPHAPYTCSEKTIEKVIGMGKKYGLGIHTHLSETMDEQQTIAERYGKTPAEYYHDLGLFDLPTIVAHCVHLSDSDMDILREKGVGVAHNPQSNMKLASGAAQVKDMLERGLNVGLGTDGPCSNNDLDMWEEMRSASFLQKCVTGDPCALPAYTTLQMATVNGAKALGRENAGVLKEGADADIILIDTCKPHMTPCHDLVANLAYCAKASDVDTVIVNGKLLMQSRKLLNTDLNNLFARANQRIGELTK